jgi:phage baseplate assembly protein gpV
MFATVYEVDKTKGLVRIDINGRASNWLPCVGFTPKIGQQVAFMESPIDGSGVVFGSTSMTDGKPVEFYMGSIDVAVDGKKIVIKRGDIEFTGNVKIDGNVELTGTIKDKKGDLTNFTTTDGAKGHERFRDFWD